MKIYNIDIRVEYLPYYLAVPLDIAMIIVCAYLVKWLFEGIWPSILFLVPAVMIVFEIWEKTKEKKERIFSVRKVDPL